MTAPTDRPLTERDPGFFEALRELEQDSGIEDPIPRHINTMLDYDLLVHRYLSVMPRSGWSGPDALGNITDKDIAIVVAARWQEVYIKFNMQRLAEVATAGPIPLPILAAHAFASLHDGARAVLFYDVLEQRDRESHLTYPNEENLT